MRYTPRQPIYLTKPKKINKENAYHNPHPKDSIEYDLLLFQQSLGVTPQSTVPAGNSKISSISSRDPIKQTTHFFTNTAIKHQQISKYQLNPRSQHLYAPTAKPAIFKKCGFNKRASQVRDTHINQNSVQPHFVGNNNFKQMAMSHYKQVQQIKGSIQDNGKSYGYSSVQQDNKQIDKICLGSTVHSQQNVIMAQENQKNRMQLMKKVYELKIEELQNLNNQKTQQIYRLQQINFVHQQEKACLISRIDQVEKQLNQLIGQNEQFAKLQTLQEELDRKQKQIMYQDLSIQTQSINQTEILSNNTANEIIKPNYQHNITFSLQGNDWFSKAKCFKSQLQRQKMHSFNLEAEFKIVLQNKQIEWRQKLQKMQKQVQLLNSRYESKCAQVKQKESLINRLIATK